MIFFSKFKNFIRQQSEKSKTFKFYIMFLNACEIFLNLIKSERDGDFELYVTTFPKVIKYFFLSREGTLC